MSEAGRDPVEPSADEPREIRAGAQAGGSVERFGRNQGHLLPASVTKSNRKRQNIKYRYKIKMKESTCTKGCLEV